MSDDLVFALELDQVISFHWESRIDFQAVNSWRDRRVYWVVMPNLINEIFICPNIPKKKTEITNSFLILIFMNFYGFFSLKCRDEPPIMEL